MFCECNNARDLKSRWVSRAGNGSDMMCEKTVHPLFIVCPLHRFMKSNFVRAPADIFSVITPSTILGSLVHIAHAEE